MKHLFALFLLMISFSTIAQESKVKYPIYIGLETGFSLGYGFINNDKILHDLFGLTFDYYFTDTRSFKTKVKYMSVEKNTTIYYEEYGYYNHYDVSYKAEFVVIPALYKWQFGKGNVKGFVQGGIYLGLEIDSKYEGYPMNYSKNPIDFGFNLGTGLRFPIISDKLYVNSEIEVYQGLFGRIPDSDGSEQSFFEEALTNLTFSLGLSYKF